MLKEVAQPAAFRVAGEMPEVGVLPDFGPQIHHGGIATQKRHCDKYTNYRKRVSGSLWMGELEFASSSRYPGWGWRRTANRRISLHHRKKTSPRRCSGGDSGPAHPR